MAAAGAGDRAPGCATTVADAPHAAISTFPTGKLLDKPPLPTDSAWDLCAGPGSYTALPRCRLNGRSQLCLTRSYLPRPKSRSWDVPATSEDAAASLLARLLPPLYPLGNPGATSSWWRGFPTHPLGSRGLLLPKHKPSWAPTMAGCTSGPPPHHTRGQGHQHLPPLASPLLSDHRVTLVLPS